MKGGWILLNGPVPREDEDQTIRWSPALCSGLYCISCCLYLNTTNFQIICWCVLFPCWLCHGFWTFSWSNGNFNVNYVFVPPPVQGRCDVPTIFWIHCPYSNLIIFQATKIELVVGVCFPVVAWCWVGTNRDVLFHHQCCVYRFFGAIILTHVPDFSILFGKIQK